MKLPKDIEIPDEKHLHVIGIINLVAAISFAVTLIFFARGGSSVFTIISVVLCIICLVANGVSVLRGISNNLQGVVGIRKVSIVTTIACIVLDIVHVIASKGGRTMALSIIGISALLSGVVLILCSNIISQANGDAGIFAIRHELPKLSLNETDKDKNDSGE